MKRIILAVILACMVACGFGQPARAQEANLASLKAGVDRLHALGPAIGRARNLLGGMSFGPFHYSGSCGYHCLGSLCFSENHWNVNTPTFVGFKGALDQRLANVSAQVNAFDPAFSPVRQWLTGTLPQFSQYFDQAAGRLTSDAAIIGKGGDPAATARANQDIVDTLSQISARLTAGSNQLRDGISRLANFNRNFIASLKQVESLNTALGTSIATDRDKVVRDTNGWPCGQGDALRQYDGGTVTVRAGFNIAVTTASATSATAAQSDKDVSLMLGTVLNIQTRYQTVLNQIKAAQLTPQGAVQTLHVDVAAAAWRDLAQYAVQQLGKS